MSPDRFDLLERWAPLFEAPEPSFDGFLRRRDRRRRNQRLAAGVVAITVFVAPIIWIVATPGGFDRILTPQTTGPSVPVDPTGVGFLGLPPDGATPSTPSRGELVLGMGFGHTSGDAGRFSLHVYADGRVIWQRLGGGPGDTTGSSTGLIEQRLTPHGVQLVLTAVLATGLFDHDRALVDTPGLYYGGIEVRAGDRLVHLDWGNAGSEQGTKPIATTPTPAQVQALEHLDARLEDLTSWLPASSWEDSEPRAFVPSRYIACYMGRDEPLGRTRILDLLPAPAEDLLGTVDMTQSAPFGFRGSIPFWCSDLTIQQARELVGVIEDAGATRNDSETLSYAYSPAVGAEAVDIGLEPALPHQ